MTFRRLATWASPPWRWWRGRRLVVGHHVSYLIPLFGQLGVELVPYPCFVLANVDGESLNALHLLSEDGRFGDVVVHDVIVVEDQRWNAFPIHHKTRVEVSRKWDKQYQVTFSQSWGSIPFHSMWDERIVELVPDLFTHTYQVKLIVELGEDSGTNIWCKMLARVNNVGKYSQIRKWNK